MISTNMKHPATFVGLVLILTALSLAVNCKDEDEHFGVHHKMTSNELEKYFGVSSVSDVPEYDVSYPVNANEFGHEISESRAKRDADISGRKYYHLRAFDENLHLSVAPNKDLLGPNFYIETRHEDGSTLISDAPHRNFYHGHVVSRPDAMVALSENRGVSGAIRTKDDEMLYFEPIPHHLVSKTHAKKSLPHLVTKRSVNSFKRKHYQMYEEEANVRREEPRLSEEDESAVENNSEDKHRFYEILFVADHLIVEQVGLKELPEMLLIVGNIVARIYTDTTFGEIKLTYVVTKLLIFNNGEFNYFRNASNGDKLSALGRWMRANNPADDNNPEHVDAGTLFTSYTGGGLALVGGICAWRDMRSVVGSIGLSSSDIAAHENFHNLGGSHDGAPGCPNGAHIMSTYVSSGSASFTWSNCSKNFIQGFLRSSRSSCLRDAPQRQRPQLPPIIRDMLPGEVFDGNKQCEYRGVLGARQCHVGCGHLFCQNPNGGCYSTGGSPAEGTRCADGKWCIRGECVTSGARPVDGGWGAWSDYSECSRSCGVGVRHRKKVCNNPSPQNGGKQCPEPHNSNEYETCNLNDCPSDSKSFRLEQCHQRKSNESRPYIRGGAECYLWCVMGGWASLHGQVIDGTRCYGRNRRGHICVRGECKALGCDKGLTGNIPDRCGVCAGDGSTCKLNIVHHTPNSNSAANGQINTIVELKPGYTNVHAIMKGISKNTIGIQKTDGSFLINLPTNTKTINYHGMEITYINKDDTIKDEIVIKGKVTRTLKLVFVYKGGNDGAEVRFYVPESNPTKPPQDVFKWGSGDWKTCWSALKCGQGVSFRDLHCYRSDDNTTVGVHNCLDYERPLSERPCDLKQCEAEWHSYTTPCSKTCGRGIEREVQVCRRMQNGHSWIKVDDSECTKPRPEFTPEERHCNKIACPPEYVTGPWSQCSTSCGEGVVTRSIKCEIINNEGGLTQLPIQTCEHYKLKRPMTSEKCNYDNPCIAKPIYHAVGCYHDKRSHRTMSPLKSFRSSIVWEKHQESLAGIIEKCAILAEEHKLEYFAIQFYAECWGSPTDKPVIYDQYGVTDECFKFTYKNRDLAVGKSFTNSVYRLKNAKVTV